MTPNHDDDLIRLTDCVVRLVIDHYDKNGAGILLSSLGEVITKHFHRRSYEIYPYQPLRVFIYTHLQDKVVTVGDPPKIFAYPRHAYNPSDLINTSDNTVAAKTRPRYIPSFWAAFAKPLDDGNKRYLSSTQPYYFTDLHQQASPPHDHYEIPESLICSGENLDHEQRRNVICENIDKWLALRTLAAETFSRPRKLTMHPNIEQKRIDHHTSAGRISALLDFLQCIPDGDRARLSVPCDVLYRLLK